MSSPQTVATGEPLPAAREVLPSVAGLQRVRLLEQQAEAFVRAAKAPRPFAPTGPIGTISQLVCAAHVVSAARPAPKPSPCTWPPWRRPTGRRR